MIRKLQIKLIALCMAALFVVLSAILAGVNIINYNGVVKRADEMLGILTEHKGRFPMDRGALPRGMSPETPYEIRYFSVLLNRNGEVAETETSRIIAVGAEDAVRLAQEVATDSRSQGFIEKFRFLCRTEGDAMRIAFLDCGRHIDNFQNFLVTSVLISLGGFLLVFVLIVGFSKRIIRPISESYEKQKRFITDAGHEIKTPLTIIHADADVLEEELGENEWLTDIRRQTKRLTALTNDLVYLSRMEETDGALQMIDFPVSDVVSEEASSFQALAQTQNKGFRCDVQPMLSMKGDEKTIRQLTAILLDNALKYSPEDSAVSLSMERKNKALRLAVSNETASPLPAANLSVLFDRFYRSDTSRNSGTGGHGIGLSMAKAIVEKHGGKIQAHSKDGRSLLITCTFPL